MAKPRTAKGTKGRKTGGKSPGKRNPKRGPKTKAQGTKVKDAKGAVLHITDANFDQVRMASELLVIDFWAEWCGPCQMFGPILERFAKTHAGEVTVAKMNVDENQETPQLFNVESIPSIVFFKKGEAVAMVVGAVPQANLEKVLEDVKKKECE